MFSASVMLSCRFADVGSIGFGVGIGSGVVEDGAGVVVVVVVDVVVVDALSSAASGLTPTMPIMTV